MVQRFKPNFWQILGIVLILVAGSYLIRSKTGNRPGDAVEPAMPTQQTLPPATTRR